jgi:hypothetical protein
MYPQTLKSSKVCMLYSGLHIDYGYFQEYDVLCFFCGMGIRERNIFERQQLGGVTESEIVNVIDFANSMPISTPGWA